MKPIRSSGWVPLLARRAFGRVRGEATSSAIRREIDRLSRSTRRIVAGPWLGEVGFELLYWIPFLRWAAEHGGLDVSRVVAVSRGGPVSWYRGLASTYRDVFEFVGPDEFRHRNEHRTREVGEQKQVRRAAFDDELACQIEASLGEPCDWLHPSLMYRAMQPYWWKHAPIDWVSRHARFARLEAPAPPPDLALPHVYTAVKFYFNDAFGRTPTNRAAARQIVERLSQLGPVVSLSTGLTIDDHAETGPTRAVDIIRDVPACRNLDVQTAVLARSQAFVGTYGGFSYLAPFLGVRTTAVYDDPAGFDHAHLALAREVFTRLGTPTFDVQALSVALA